MSMAHPIIVMPGMDVSLYNDTAAKDLEDNWRSPFSPSREIIAQWGMPEENTRYGGPDTLKYLGPFSWLSEIILPVHDPVFLSANSDNIPYSIFIFPAHQKISVGTKKTTSKQGKVFAKMFDLHLEEIKKELGISPKDLITKEHIDQIQALIMKKIKKFWLNLGQRITQNASSL